MTEQRDDPFPVVWDDPADAGQCWRFSAEHMPNAVAPLEFELGTKGFLEGFGWGMLPRQFNYFIFFALGGPAASPPPSPPTTASVRDGARRWREEVLPEVLGHIERYRMADFASMTNASSPRRSSGWRSCASAPASSTRWPSGRTGRA